MFDHNEVEKHLTARPEEVNTTMIAALTLIAARTFQNTENLLCQPFVWKGRIKEKTW